MLRMAGDSQADAGFDVASADPVSAAVSALKLGDTDEALRLCAHAGKRKGGKGSSQSEVQMLQQQIMLVQQLYSEGRDLLERAEALLDEGSFEAAHSTCLRSVFKFRQAVNEGGEDRGQPARDLLIYTEESIALKDGSPDKTADMVAALVSKGYAALKEGSPDEALRLAQRAAWLQTGSSDTLNEAALRVQELYSAGAEQMAAASAALGRGFLEAARADCIAARASFHHAAAAGGADRAEPVHKLLTRIHAETESEERRVAAAETLAEMLREGYFAVQEDALNPEPYTLHPTPYTLHPAPYPLPPTLYTQEDGDCNKRNKALLLCASAKALRPTCYTLNSLY